MWDSSLPSILHGTGDEEGAESPKMTETELARVLDQWLQQHAWETYPEVVLAGFPGRPDLIATRNGICQVLECKISLTLGVIEQATRWHRLDRLEQVGLPHIVWVAVPSPRGRRNELLDYLLSQFGIGVITVKKTPAVRRPGGMSKRGGVELRRLEEFRAQSYQIAQAKVPRIVPGSRRAAKQLMSLLNSDMRIATPGARGGETAFMTPFRRTMGLVEQLMADGQERHTADIVRWVNENGGHHYSSDSAARNSLSQQLDRLGYPRTRPYGPWFQLRSTVEVVSRHGVES